MLLRTCLSFLFLVFGVANALAGAAITNTSLSGAAIGSGYNFTNGVLYIPSTASLLTTAFPFTISADVLVPPAGFSAATGNSLLRASEQLTGTITTGFDLILQGNTSTDRAARLQSRLLPGASLTACDAGSPNAICWRGLAPSGSPGSPLNDGRRHHVCAVWTASGGDLYLDGILRDHTATMSTFTLGNQFWRLGPGFPQTGDTGTIYDVRVFSKALTADECGQIHRLQLQNQIPNSGTINSNLLLSMPLNNCVTTGILVTCADASGNGNDGTNDKAPPIVTVLTTPPNPSSGTVSLTASCQDPAGIGGLVCQRVCYMIDGGPFSAVCPTTAPYTYALDTTKIVDGAHTITAVGINFVGIAGTSAGKAITTSNSVAATNYFFDPAGSDSNDCKAATLGGGHGPCASIAKLQTLNLIGGDTVNMLHDATFTMTAGFKLCGGDALEGGTCTQNYFPSNGTLTFTTYGGGSCNALSGATTGCATWTSASGTGIAPFKAVNAPNVTLQNQAMIGNTAALSGSLSGIEFDSTFTTDNSTGITVINNLVKDYSYEIHFNNWANGAYVGLISGYTISDNFVTDSTRTIVSPIDHVSRTFPVNPASLDGIRVNANTQGTIQANIVQFMGGGTGNNGNGISLHNFPYAGTTPTLVQFNVQHDFGANDMSILGGAVGIYTSSQAYATIQFNESYKGWPSLYPQIAQDSTHPFIDYDCFDIDDGSLHVTLQYNYAHDCPVQSGYNVINFNIGTFAWDFNYIRYNISENNASMMYMAGPVLAANSYVYNNTSASNLPSTFGSGCWGGSGGTALIVNIINNLCITNINTASPPITNPTGYPSAQNATFEDITFFGTSSAPTPSPTGLVINNAYYQAGTFQSGTFKFQQQFHGAFCCSTNFALLADVPGTWTGQEVGSIAGGQAGAPTDPKIVGPVDAGGTCYVSGTPAGPQPCPANYALQHGSPVIGVGLDLTQAPYSLNIGTRDYYGNSIPHGTGTGYNIGSDGGAH